MNYKDFMDWPNDPRTTMIPKLQHMAAFAAILMSSNTFAATPAESCKQLFDEALYKDALAPCLEAAKSGHLDSQSILGELYERQGNSKETFHWWSRAAEAGYIPARNQLAMKFYYGGSIFGPEEGWTQDYKRAYAIWLEDARNGHAPAQFMVAEMHHRGQGVMRDYPAAWAWFRLALEQGYKLASDSLVELSKKMPPQQKQDGKRKLADYRKTIEQRQAD
jgi:hypothetical protein